MNKQIAAVRVKNNETKVSSIVKEFKSSSLSLRQTLNLSNNMFSVCSIFQLRMLSKLCWHSIVHLIYNIFCSLGIIQSLSWYKYRGSHSCLASIYLLLLVLIWLLWLTWIRRIYYCLLNALRISSSKYSRLL
jgi:hypothetical protein